MAQADGPEAGLEALAGLGSQLDGFHAFHVSRGELYRRNGEDERAREDFDRALTLASNEAERRLIRDRLESLAAVKP